MRKLWATGSDAGLTVRHDIGIPIVYSRDAVPNRVHLRMEFTQPLRLETPFGGTDCAGEPARVGGKQVEKYPGLCDVGIIGHSLFLSRPLAATPPELRAFHGISPHRVRIEKDYRCFREIAAPGGEMPVQWGRIGPTADFPAGNYTRSAANWAAGHMAQP